MDRSLFVSPSAAHFNLCATSAAKTLEFGVGVSGPGTAGVVSGAVGYTTGGGLAGVSIATVPATGTYTVTWPAWNYGVGANPQLLATVGITITPTGAVTSGTIELTVYGIPVTITLSSDVMDDFDDVDGTALGAHAPLSQPAGGIQGWHGLGMNHTLIQGDTAQPGCCSGVALWHRLFAELHDNFYVYVEALRPAGIGNAPMGIIGRASGVAGSTNTGVDIIYFEATNRSDTLVDLQWSQLDAGVIVIYQQAIETGYAWARGVTKRLTLLFSGSTVYFYLCDSGGGNPVLKATKTLSPDWNDSGHDYVGFTSTHAGRGVAFDDFRAGALILLLDTDTLYYLAPYGSTSTDDQTVEITTDPAFVPLSLTTVDSEAWVTSSLAAATSPTTMTVSVDPTGLAPDTYNATVTVNGEVVDIVLEVFATLALDPDALDFTAEWLGPDPDSKTVAVSPGGVLMGLSIGTITYGPGATNWLAVTIDDTTTPAIARVQPATGSLAPGIYTATVQVVASAHGVTNSPQNIAVTFLVAVWFNNALAPGTVWADNAPTPGNVWVAA
jgi:hypothetical protein